MIASTSSDSMGREYSSCVEIVMITVNDRYHEDARIVDESLSILSNAEKLQK